MPSSHDTSLTTSNNNAQCGTAFVVPLRHPQSANNYQAVLDLLKSTVSSLLRQSDSDIKIIIACNQLPDLGIADPRLYFIEVPFDNPTKEKGAKVPLENLLVDKGSKLVVACTAALSFNPHYIFFIDADDWAHQDLSKALKKKASIATAPEVLYVNQGFLVNISTWRYRKVYGLNRYCGSTYAYHNSFIKRHLSVILYRFAFIQDHLQRSDTLSRNDFETPIPKQDTLLNCLERGFFYNVFADHGWTYFYLVNSCELKPKALKLSAICWVVDNGENHSATHLSNRACPFSDTVRKQYIDVDLALPEARPIARIRSFLSARRSQLTWFISRLRGINLY